MRKTKQKSQKSRKLSAPLRFLYISIEFNMKYFKIFLILYLLLLLMMIEVFSLRFVIEEFGNFAVKARNNFVEFAKPKSFKNFGKLIQKNNE